ncbi:hypothetical protein GDO81_021658 [Engystomops pustulosus]|uniref:Uncharacterized protein n=1 Tax=Engystomops pustulosus TaxID=76066 RepID=A0AAV6YQP7_ENGPU|nr:hypothetical protein GDO81_021658 [Engystomops pustulosus]
MRSLCKRDTDVYFLYNLGSITGYYPAAHTANATGTIYGRWTFWAFCFFFIKNYTEFYYFLRNPSCQPVTS